MSKNIILVIIISTQVCNPLSSDQFVCVPGLLTWGATSPKGDIMLEVGKTLEVNCTIDLSHAKINGRTSEDIRFSVAKHEIPENLLQKSIINASTAMLRVENMNVSTPLIHCYLNNPDTHICENQVDVGYPPLPVQNLKCVARDWASLNCTWTKPQNNIFTTYNISYSFRQYLMHCPQKVILSRTTESCEWNGRTDPHYHQNMRVITIVMTGTNYLRPEGIKWTYQFHNWEIMIPSKPQRIFVKAVSSHEIDVRWTFLNFQLFIPGLDHRVTICPVQKFHSCSVTEIKTNHLANLTRQFSVRYAYTEYAVEIQMKSQAANDTPEFWSPAESKSIRTLPKRPEHPPTTGIGSFELFSKYRLRDVTIYWLKIPQYLQNGPNFHYKFSVFEDGVERRDILPEVKEGREYVIFRNLDLKSYTFKIRSVNSEGESEDKAVINIASGGEVPKEPLSVSKVDYANGTHEVSWKHPLQSRFLISSYTVYRCRGSKLQCEELVEWFDVQPEKSHYVFHDLPVEENPLFAVSANTKYSSSGMVVASCELIYSKIPGKLRDVSATYSSSNTIDIKWGMDCTFKPGLVQGFRITFCKVQESEECIKPSQRVGLHSGNATSFSLVNLEPFSSYKVWVSMITRAGESQSSDPILVNTTEAAPSDPPQVTSISTTNTSALLEIESPIRPNGIIQKYEILFTLTEPGGRVVERMSTLEVTNLEEGDDNLIYYELSPLETNSQYVVRVAACTISCSNLSEPMYIQTRFGYTKVTRRPALTYEDGQIFVSWSSPSHVGGPIEYFEIMVEINGEAAEPHKVEYDVGKISYMDSVDLKCETNTNVTARVRAVSILDGVEVVGDWSPEGSFNCYGSHAWFIWILIVLASLICFVMLTVVSLKCWRKIKVMHSLDLIAPPGMELQLNGFSESQIRRMRQNSRSDTHPFRKEDLICEAPGYHSSFVEDAKEFISSDSKENEKSGGQEGVEDLNSINVSFGNDAATLSQGLGTDKCPVWLLRSSNMVSGNEDGAKRSPKFPLNNTRNISIQPSLPGQTPAQDELLENGISPTPSNPFISDRSPRSSGDERETHYRTLDFEPDESTYFDDERHSDSSDPAPAMMNGGLQLGNLNQICRPDVGNNSYANSNTFGNHTNGVIPNHVVPEPTLNSAYVKWTSLKIDPLLNGKTPYCQVGILLEP